MNMTKRVLAKRPIIQAAEDAFVVGTFSALGGLITAGFPPSIEILYGCSLAASLAGLVAYAKARKIQTG